MQEQKFTSEFLSHIHKGLKVLDLGAGDGHFSQMFADKGAVVTAVDIKVPADLDESITTVRMKVEDFVTRQGDETYDAVFMRNILQFLDKHWVFEILFPWLHEHMNNGGIVGIAAFYKEPEPPFDHSLRSLYTTQELSEQVSTWQELLSEQYKHHGSDMAGTMRIFFVSEVIVRKN